MYHELHNGLFYFLNQHHQDVIYIKVAILSMQFNKLQQTYITTIQSRFRTCPPPQKCFCVQPGVSKHPSVPRT